MAPGAPNPFTHDVGQVTAKGSCRLLHHPDSRAMVGWTCDREFMKFFAFWGLPPCRSFRFKALPARVSVEVNATSVSESLVFAAVLLFLPDVFHAVKDAVRTAAADLAVFLFVSRTGLVISFSPLQHLASPCPREESAWVVFRTLPFLSKPLPLGGLARVLRLYLFWQLP